MESVKMVKQLTFTQEEDERKKQSLNPAHLCVNGHVREWCW